MFRLSPEDWMFSAANVSGQTDDLAAGHLSSNDRIEAAQAGWQGASAMALNAKLAEWSQKSTTLISKIANHAFELQQAAVQHASAEADRAQTLAHIADDGADSRSTE